VWLNSWNHGLSKGFSTNDFMKIFRWNSGIKALAGLLVVCAGWSAWGQEVVINEVMASNEAAVQNEQIYPDWVELYNTTGSDINLTDWSFSNANNNRRKYVFPTNTIIRARSFLILWCDDLTNAPGLHTGFDLSSTSDEVFLNRGAQAGFVTENEFGFGPQITDLSIGRIPDGGSFASMTLTAPTPLGTNVAVPLGVVTNLSINEAMARPSSGDDWFELYNPETNHVKIGGLVFSDQTATPATNRAVTNLSFIAAGGFLDFEADNLQSTDADHVDFQLSPNSPGDRVILFAANRTTRISELSWVTMASDASVGRLPDGSTNIVVFPAGRATRRASNFQLLTEVVINEILTHTDPPLEDAIEFHNPWTTNVNIGGYWLSNARNDPMKYRIAPNTIVPAGGYVVFYERAGPNGSPGFNPDGTGTNRSFTFNSARGDEVYLHSADAAGNLTFFRASRDFGPQANGVSFGRYVTSDGHLELTAMRHHTFGVTNPTSLTQFRTGTGGANPYPRVGPLVINEIMYHPPDILTESNTIIDNELDEYVEIYNPGPNAVPLYDPTPFYRHDGTNYASGLTNTWRVRGEIDFNFPTNVILGAGEYLLLVNFDPNTNATQTAEWRNKYSVPANVRMFGPYGEELANGGGTIELNKPDPPQAPDRGDDAYRVPYVRVEKIDYGDGGSVANPDGWPMEPDGGGLALQRVHALGYGNDETNWIAAGTSPGKVFVPNAPPIIDPIADITTNELRRIQFFVMARDTNDPPQGITFSLDAYPEGATIDPLSGLFKWRPREEHGENPPVVYPITVRVTDNGSPPESTTRTFNVTVWEVNRPPYFRIREQWVKGNNTLVFLTGFDVDLPAQLVTYSAINPPGGLTVDPNAGVVTWTPTDTQTGVHRVTIEAFDDPGPGLPMLTNRFTYTINVLRSTDRLVWPSIRYQPPTDEPAQVWIEWEADLDRMYDIEYTEDWVSWSLLYDGIVPDRTAMSLPDGIFTQRYYRIFERPPP
jgi:hypothetical protein